MELACMALSGRTLYTYSSLLATDISGCPWALEIMHVRNALGPLRGHILDSLGSVVASSDGQVWRDDRKTATGAIYLDPFRATCFYKGDEQRGRGKPCQVDYIWGLSDTTRDIQYHLGLSVCGRRQ